MPEAQAVVENTLTSPPPSSSDQSLTGPTPTPQPDTETPTLPGDTSTENGAAQGADASPATTETPGATTAKAADAPTDEEKKKQPWFQRRIDQLTHEKWEERREKEALKAQNSALLEQLAETRGNVRTTVATQPVANDGLPQAQLPSPTPTTKQGIVLTEAELEARVDQRAEEKSRVSAFNKACNNIAEAGKTEFGDFDTSLRTFGMLGGIPAQMLQTLVELPDAHKILYALGKDPELAERVVKLPPMKMALEIARLEKDIQKPTTRPVSTAPKPITPLDAAARSQDDPEKMSTQEWIQWREKTKKSRW